MNVTYRLPSEELTDEFVKNASKDGMVGLKGYRTVGGIRASIYNAMPVEGARRWPTSWGLREGKRLGGPPDPSP